MFTTNDGSTSLTCTRFDEAYHSKFGAVSESRHVFVNAGLREWYRLQPKKQRPVQVFEMGFGTGLNAVLSLQWAEDLQRAVAYHSIDLFPLSEEHLNALNHADFMDEDLCENVRQVQHGEWDKVLDISPNFTLHKQQISLLDIELPNAFYDVIFFDAFSPKTQPELWIEEVFRKLYAAAKKGAVLTTYSAKGDVRRALKAAGFSVEKIPGPPGGKLEMTRAKKLN